MSQPGYTVTLPSSWSLLCQACNGPLRSESGRFTMLVWVVPRDGGLRLFHANSVCEPR